jgi:septal ring factor EnvC (AmiA/AmiB activator)
MQGMRAMTYARTWAVWPFLAVFVSACTTAECDPSQGGFIRGIACTGKYEQRQEEKQATLTEEQVRQKTIQDDYTRTKAEQDATERKREAAERRYAALQSDLDAMRAKLSRSKTANKDLERKIADLEAKNKLLQDDTFSPEAEKEKQLQKLRGQKEALEREVDLALR